jgi:hypothetical protein
VAAYHLADVVSRVAETKFYVGAFAWLIAAAKGLAPTYWVCHRNQSPTQIYPTTEFCVPRT